MKCKPIAIAMASAALVLVSLQPTVGFANDCEVKPFDAYSTAIKRGWKFRCPVFNPQPGLVVSTLFLPEPNGPLLCQWRTGPVPSPVPAEAAMWFFEASGDATQLKNGWRIKWYEITGGQWTKLNTARPRIDARMQLDRRDHTFNYRLTKMVLTKPNGNCSNAIHEAF